MLGNLLTPSPAAMAAQKEQKANDRNVRAEELERLRERLEYYTTERNVSKLLPEDVETMKKFLKARISTIQSQPNITEDALLTLMDNKESQNYENLDQSVKLRAQFSKEFNGYKTDYTEKSADLKAKGVSVPPSFASAIKISDAALAWLKKSQFETPDIYEDKRRNYSEQFSAENKGQKLGGVERAIEEAKKEEAQSRDSFSVSGLFEDVANYVGGYLGLFLIFVAMLLGASLATNLNLYKHWAFRVLYAVYGALFFFVVIPYSLAYRWAWLGKQPKFYSIIPLFPYHWNNRLVQILLGWISFRPDDDILALQEWEKESSGN
jgi:hypothetical protein